MKTEKILAGIMSMSMLASLVTLPTKADETDIQGLYASTKNIYLTLADDVSEDDIEVTDADGKEISVAKKVEQDDGTLRIELAKALELKTVAGKNQKETDGVIVKVGDEAKGFKIREILAEDFENTNTYTNIFQFNPRGSTASVLKRDNNSRLYMYQNTLGNFIISNTDFLQLKDYTVEFDMETYRVHREAIVFNKLKTGTYDGFHWSSEGDAYHGWVFESKMNTAANELHRTCLKPNGEAQYNAEAVNGTMVKPSSYKLEVTDGQVTINDTDKTTPPSAVKYSVDKIGKTGVLSLDNNVKDVYKEENSAEKGAFFIGSAYPGPNTNGEGFSLDNISVTVCDEVSVGTIKITDANADSTGFTYTFDTDISKVGKDNIKANVLVKCGTDDVPYDYEISGKTLLIYPDGGVEAETEYTVTIKKSFGYELVLSEKEDIKILSRKAEEGTITFDNASFVEGALELTFSHGMAKVKNIKDFVKLTLDGNDVDYNVKTNKEKLILSRDDGFEDGKTYSITVLEGFGYEKVLLAENATKTATMSIDTITVSDINAGEKKMYLTFNCDMDDIVDTAAVKKNINVIDYLGNSMDYTPIISGQSITLNLNSAITPDKVYDIIIRKGFGKEFVKETKQEIKKYFMLETVKTLDFSDDTQKASSFFEVDTLTQNGSYKPVMTIKNNKAYFRLCRYGALYFSKQGIENMENYTISFDFEKFNLNDNQDGWESRVPMLFNRNVIDSSMYFDTTVRQEGYGWTIGWFKQVGNAITRFDGAIRPWVVASLPGAVAYARGCYGEESESLTIDALKAKTGLKFDKDENDTTVTDTSDQNHKAKITIDKTGYSGTLFVDGTEVSTVDSKALTDDLSKTLGSEWVPQNKGYFVIGGASGGGALAISNVKIYQYREVEEKGVEIIKEDIPKTLGTSFDIGATVRNYKSTSDTAKVIAVVYDKDGNMISAKQKDLQTLTAGEIKTHTFKFDSISGASSVRILLINEATIIKDTDFSNVSIVNDTKADNQLNVNAKLKAQGRAKEAVLVLLKDGIGTDWETISAQEGAIVAVKVGKNDEQLSFVMKYVVPQDYSTGYVVNKLYSEDDTPIATYKYMSESNIVENVTQAGISYESFAEFAAAAGIDLSYIKNENQKTYFERQLKDKNNTLTDIDKVRDFAEKTRTKIEMLDKLKNNTSTYNEVNNLLEEYKSIINLDAYNNLSDENKIKVCTQFVKSDYESGGLESFITAFNTAVENAAKQSNENQSGSHGGSSGGSSSGGSSSGIMYIPNINSIEKKELFSDIAGVEWAREAIEFLAKNGVLNGVGENRFAPESAVTREQLAKIVVLTFNLYDETAENDFTDVSKNSWSYKFIASANKSGVMNGVGNGRFEPSKAVTREDIATVLYRAAQKAGAVFNEAKNDFADFEDVQNYAKEAVSMMAGANVINGFPDNTFRPRVQATRAQTAKLIYYVINLMK